MFPFFTIIVPIYNVEKYLVQCVESLLMQEYDDYEIILVDDGSPDKCPIICDEYASKDSRIRVIHKPNGGLSDARNVGLKVAQGRYITFIDSDDFWNNRNVLEGIRKVIDDNNNPDIVVSDFIKYYEHGNKFLYPSVISNPEYNGKDKIEVLKYLYFCQGDMKMSACQKFVKRELLIDASFEKGLIAEDIDWSLKIYPQAESICVYPKPYYCYRQQRKGSITNTASQRSFDSLIYILDKWKVKIQDMSIPENEKELYQGYLAYQLSICMALYGTLTKHQRKKAREELKNQTSLFSFKLNDKTLKVRKLVNLIGIKNSCRILSLYIKLRSSFKLG